MSSDNIIKLAKNFKSSIDMLNRINELENENAKLKALIGQNIVPSTNKNIVVDSQEESILAAQIAILENRAMQRELSLDEVRSLDLLIKNKLLLEKRKLEKERNKDSSVNVSEEQLLAIVNTNDNSNNKK